MKFIMTIDEYKKYKNKEMSLLDIKMNNIGLKPNRIGTWVKNNKNILMGLAVLFLTSAPDLKLLPSLDPLGLVDNILTLLAEAYQTANPHGYIEEFFKCGGTITGWSI